jgi:hypothetical protein
MPLFARAFSLLALPALRCLAEISSAAKGSQPVFEAGGRSISSNNNPPIDGTTGTSGKRRFFLIRRACAGVHRKMNLYVSYVR